jgi:nucleoside-diphosphate-sugar epimerase
MKTALVLGGGGFIGSHLVKRLKEEDYWVRVVDLKEPEFWESFADDFIIGDLRANHIASAAFRPLEDVRHFDEVYQLAADMGGAGYLFTGDSDADIMHNSALINMNVLTQIKICPKKTKVFYASSACVYPEYNQVDPDSPVCVESSVYPAEPDSEYGWEKLFSERMYLAFARNYNTDVRIARFHGIFGPYGTWDGGKEKAPAAICRKVAQATSEIEIWGDGEQTRSFMYIDDAVETIRRFMKSDFQGPMNIGSEEMVSINKYAEMVMDVADKNLSIKHIDGPEGVRGRNSDNTLMEEKLGWTPQGSLRDGVEKTYKWIEEQVLKASV